MKLSVDRLLRGVWLVNGIVLLLILVGFGAMLLFDWIGHLGAGDDAVRIAEERATAAPAEAQRVRAVRFEAPQQVRGTGVRLVRVRNGSGFAETTTTDAYAYDRRGKTAGPVVNVAFLPPDGGAGRLLFDRPVYVSSLSFPGDRSFAVPSDGTDPDSLTTWITYVAALDDTNGDSRLDHRDETALYVSALDGTGFRRVLPAGYRLGGHHTVDARTIYVDALELPKERGERIEEERLPQRAFLYDVPTARLQPFTALDSLARRAGEVLAW